MRVGAVAESVMERVALAVGLVPKPLVETQMAYTLARALMAGCKLGVFDALAKGAASAREVAATCGTDAVATEHLLDALASTSYVRRKGGAYALTAEGSKWLVSGGKSSLSGKLLLQYLEWEWLGKLEEYVRSGKALDAHDTMTDPEAWRLYQAGMRALASAASAEVGSRMPVPRGAARMLDIGGSHGLYSLAICQRNPGLRSTILELPAAVEHAAALAADDGAGTLLEYRAGNALTDDLGTNQFDLVLIMSVVHHFTAAQNAELARRVKAALRPGGLYVIGDVVRNDPAKSSTGQIGALMDLYFSFSSTSGTWTVEEMRGWQTTAGLTPGRPIFLRSIPSFVLAAARA